MFGGPCSPLRRGSAPLVDGLGSGQLGFVILPVIADQDFSERNRGVSCEVCGLGESEGGWLHG
jgi:hypothetical protein